MFSILYNTEEPLWNNQTYEYIKTLKWIPISQIEYS